MKILAIISQKGGVGKTTLATALAVAGEAGGKRVAVFDLDPQLSATFWADRRKGNRPGEAETPVVREINVLRLPHYLDAMREVGADLVVLDCPPVHRDIAAAAVEAADRLLGRMLKPAPAPDDFSHAQEQRRADLDAHQRSLPLAEQALFEDGDPDIARALSVLGSLIQRESARQSESGT